MFIVLSVVERTELLLCDVSKPNNIRPFRRRNQTHLLNWETVARLSATTTSHESKSGHTHQATQ